MCSIECAGIEVSSVREAEGRPRGSEMNAVWGEDKGGAEEPIAGARGQ